MAKAKVEEGKWQKIGVTTTVVGLVVTAIGVYFGYKSLHPSPGLHSQASVSTCGISQSYQIERSPNLGISFYQNNQLALMSSVNPNDAGIPQTNVCLSSAPFEIWFPTLGSKGLVQVCVSAIAEEFRINPFRHEANAAGCLSNNGDGPTPSYIGGFLPEASLQYGTSFMIFGKRAEPAANGDEKYYVSTLYSVPSAKSFTYNTVPLSKQTANLYMIIYSTRNYDDPASQANIEHFVLRFR